MLTVVNGNGNLATSSPPTCALFLYIPLSLEGICYKRQTQWQKAMIHIFSPGLLLKRHAWTHVHPWGRSSGCLSPSRILIYLSDEVDLTIKACGVVRCNVCFLVITWNIGKCIPVFPWLILSEARLEWLSGIWKSCLREITPVKAIVSCVVMCAPP